MSLEVERVVTGRWRENCYVVRDGASCVVIDPGGEAGRILELIHARTRVADAILLTHAHYDHIGAVAELRAALGAKTYLHSADARLLKQVNFYRRVFDGEATITVPEIDQMVDALSPSFEVGAFIVQALPTPGHTPGGVSFLIGNHLFSGDTLFKGKIGRIDLPGGNRELLKRSLEQLRALSPETIVHPGHGDSTVLGDELKTNTELIELLS